MNYDNKVVLTDVDGVCLNWEFAFHAWVGQKGLTPKVEDRGMFYSLAQQYHISNEETWELVSQFNESAAIAFLPPLRDAIYYIKRLHEEHGYKFHAITSVSDDENVVKLRKMNLRKLFGETCFTKIDCLPLAAPKDEFLSYYEGSGMYWIEDNILNAETGRDMGLKTIMMEHGYNMHYRGPGISLVKNWKEVYEILTGED